MTALRELGAPHGVRRVSLVQPGYDCVRHPCGRNGCGTSPGANHGIHGDEWHYAVVGDAAALSLSVFSHVFPPSVPREPPFRDLPPLGVTLTLHTRFPVEETDVRTGSTAPCTWLGRCYSDEGSGLEAEAFFREHGASAYAQPEPFWLALERALEARVEGARAASAATRVVQCPTCAGTGLVSAGRSS